MSSLSIIFFVLIILISSSSGGNKTTDWRPQIELAILIDTADVTKYDASTCGQTPTLATTFPTINDTDDDWNGTTTMMPNTWSETDTATSTTTTTTASTATTTSISWSWKEVIDFCKKIRDVFVDVGNTGSRLGLITFGNNASVVLNWKDCVDRSSFTTALNNVENRSVEHTTSSDLVGGLRHYNGDLITDDRNDKKHNYVLIFLRGCLSNYAEIEANEATKKHRTLIMVIDLRPQSEQHVHQVEKIARLVSTNLSESTLRDVIKYIKERECQYVKDTNDTMLCYYTDSSREVCVESEETVFRPADKYGYGKHCNTSAPKRDNRLCSSEYCETTCNKTMTDWSPCDKFVCGGQNVTRKLKNPAQIKEDAGDLTDEEIKLINDNCIRETFDECDCEAHPPSDQLVKLTIGIRIGLLVISLIVCTVMLIIHFVRNSKNEMDALLEGSTGSGDMAAIKSFTQPLPQPLPDLKKRNVAKKKSV